jgi:hypothetical protein
MVSDDKHIDGVVSVFGDSLGKSSNRSDRESVLGRRGLLKEIVVFFRGV